MRIFYLLTLLGLLTACEDQEAGVVQTTEAERARATHGLRRLLGSQADPVATAVGLKYNLGADTVGAIVRGYAQHHDLNLQIMLQMNDAANARRAGRILAHMRPDTVMQSVRQTQRELARRYNLPADEIGAIVYDYKAARHPASSE